MEFRKQVDIPKLELEINHQTNLFLMGSCFIENIGKYLVDNKFSAHVNPFGVLYNPRSITKSIRFLLDETEFTESDLIYDKGLYHSFYHHSSYSSESVSSILLRINESRIKASLALQNADVLLITFGTAFVYEHIEQKITVSNCHKIDSKSFKRSRLNQQLIVYDWVSLISQLRLINPTIKILFTVSPIRHWKDGAHGNQLSKAILLLAIETILNECDNCFYFPSYEILLDELRDYRFYADDLIHPSSLAISYIWERFSASYFSEDTQYLLKKWSNLFRAVNHRPFNEQTEEHKHFIRQTLLKLQDFNDKNPYFNCYKEIEDLQSRL